MFTSPCSLRSTQCAALIALAAAAGIMRMDAEETEPFADRTTRSDETISTGTERPPEGPATRFQVAFNAEAPWLALFHIAADSFAECPAEISPPRPSSAASGAAFPSPLGRGCGPTAQQHSYPFAVGPPARETTHQPLAAGTCVPGDSAARGLFVRKASRVAPADEVSSLVRVTHRFDLSPGWAGSSIEERVEPCAMSQAALRIGLRFSAALPRGQRPSRAQLA